ncbi:MAG: DUF3187 family protein [Candidatus Omnitrophota bacterium]
MRKRSLMKAVFLCIFTLFFIQNTSVFASVGSEAGQKKASGPIAIRNQLPLYLFYLQMVPDKAGVVDKKKFKANFDYTVSSITVSAFTKQSSLYIVDIDMEVSRLTFDMRYGIYDNLEVGLEIPYLSFSSGYLDNFIEAIEDGIGARTPRSREKQGSYEYDYTLRYNWQYLINQKGSVEGIGDMVLNLKYQLLKEEGCFIPNLSLRTALKFPTADDDKLLGNGEYDYGLGILIDKSFFNRLFLYLGANVMVIEKPESLEILGIDNEFYSGVIGIEYFFTDRFSVVCQATGNTTPYSHSDTNPLDNEALDLGLGCHYRFKEKENMSWRFAIIENYTAASSPDVSFHTGFTWEL